jgi:hypothetical protein
MEREKVSVFSYICIMQALSAITDASDIPHSLDGFSTTQLAASFARPLLNRVLVE